MVAELSPRRAGADPGDDAGGVERVLQGPVALLGPEQDAGERLEPQIRRVGMGQREEIQGVEEARLGESLGHESGEEGALELRVVGDDDAPFECGSEGRHQLVEERSEADVLVAEPGESLDRPGQRSPGTDERAQGEDARSARVDEQGAELEDLRALVRRETGGLQVHHRERTHAGGEAGEHLGVEPEDAGLELPAPDRRSGAVGLAHHLLDLLDLDPRRAGAGGLSRRRFRP